MSRDASGSHRSQSDSCDTLGMKSLTGCPRTKHAAENACGSGVLSTGIKAQGMECRIVDVFSRKETKRAPGRHYEIPFSCGVGIVASLRPPDQSGALRLGYKKIPGLALSMRASPGTILRGEVLDLSPYTTPVKPIKASDSIPATRSAAGMPCIALGSAVFASCSRIVAKSEIAIV